MNWSEFIIHIEEGALGKRYSDMELKNLTGVSREIIYRIRMGKTRTPQQSTIEDLEKGLGIRINAADPDNITYERIAIIKEDVPGYAADDITEEELRILKRCKELGIISVEMLNNIYNNAILGTESITELAAKLKSIEDLKNKK